MYGWLAREVIHTCDHGHVLTHPKAPSTRAIIGEERTRLVGQFSR